MLKHGVGLVANHRDFGFLCTVVGSNGGCDKVCFKEITQAVRYRMREIHDKIIARV